VMLIIICYKIFKIIILNFVGKKNYLVIDMNLVTNIQQQACIVYTYLFKYNKLGYHKLKNMKGSRKMLIIR